MNPLKTWDSIGWHGHVYWDASGFIGFYEVNQWEDASTKSDLTSVFFTREEALDALLELMAYNLKQLITN